MKSNKNKYKINNSKSKHYSYSNNWWCFSNSINIISNNRNLCNKCTLIILYIINLIWFLVWTVDMLILCSRYHHLNSSNSKWTTLLIYKSDNQMQLWEMLVVDSIKIIRHSLCKYRQINQISFFKTKNTSKCNILSTLSQTLSIFPFKSLNNRPHRHRRVTMKIKTMINCSLISNNKLESI